jgi:hypothetical protein
MAGVRQVMTPHLPDCMMPDGAEPCKGFQELLAEADRHIKTIAELRHELEQRTTQCYELYGAIQRIDAINDNMASYNPDINAVTDPILRPEPKP